jgi:hypothetical protein
MISSSSHFFFLKNLKKKDYFHAKYFPKIVNKISFEFPIKKNFKFWMGVRSSSGFRLDWWLPRLDGGWPRLDVVFPCLLLLFLISTSWKFFFLGVEACAVPFDALAAGFTLTFWTVLGLLEAVDPSSILYMFSYW